MAKEAQFSDFALLLRETDDVAVIKRPVRAGTELVHGSLRLSVRRDIPAGHKLAVKPIPNGAPVKKYGQVIGFANGDIAVGDHVHTHNLVMKDFSRDYQFCADARPVDYYAPEQMRQFQGYARPGGRVGTRNYIAVISSVNCSASVSHYVKDRFKNEDFHRDYPNVDGVIAFTHKSGCAIQPGEPHQLLMRVLAGIARHPNIAGYVMIGLGCEVNQVQFIRKEYKLDELKPGETAPTFLTIQSAGGVRRTVDAAAAAVTKLLPVANDLRRAPLPISKLVLAENCGGSDGNSGITANPALGVASDELVRYGGTSVLAETPEVYGAGHLLTRRAVSPEVAEKLIGLIRWWEDHARQHHASIDNNPSYGNKTVEQVGRRILEKILAVASGERTKSELAGIGDEEFAPWQLGPTF